MALDLLKSVIESDGDRRLPQPGAAAQGPLVPPPRSDQLSATDLISWWFQPASAALDPWEDYFTGQTSAATPTNGGTKVDTPLAPWISLQAMIAQPEDELADEEAENAVQCLYEFLHAIGRRDVDGALAVVADDYHTIEEDREFDRLALRHQIESVLGSLDGWQIETSLATIPEPLPHPNGVLILAEIQIDAYRRADEARRSIVLRRVAVLERYGHEWLISALSPV
jgi:hypothetical protein